MQVTSQLRLLYLCQFSKPAADRLLYRSIRRQGFRKIVELGVGSGQRALRMIEVAQQASAPTDIHYVGIDPFEGRSEPNIPGTSLKEIHQLLRATGVRVQLVPAATQASL